MFRHLILDVILKFKNENKILFQLESFQIFQAFKLVFEIWKKKKREKIGFQKSPKIFLLFIYQVNNLLDKEHHFFFFPFFAQHHLERKGGPKLPLFSHWTKDNESQKEGKGSLNTMNINNVTIFSQQINDKGQICCTRDNPPNGSSEDISFHNFQMCL